MCIVVASSAAKTDRRAAAGGLLTSESPISAVEIRSARLTSFVGLLFAGPPVLVAGAPAGVAVVPDPARGQIQGLVRRPQIHLPGSGFTLSLRSVCCLLRSSLLVALRGLIPVLFL